MAAGSISVPTIVPLRANIDGKLKNCIDTITPIELRTGKFYKSWNNYNILVT